ncbi:MAG: type I polyketide synthase [Nocardioides sp.]
MTEQTHPRPTPVAVVGTAAIMPEAPDAATFWANITGGRYCITDVPPERWDPALYYDPDPHAVDKTYSRIGGWVRDFEWDPIAWKLPIPPKVSDQMDPGQRWAVAAARAALIEAGWPGWGVDSNRVAVILGNAIGGEKHYQTSMRIKLPEVLRHLERVPAMAGLAPEVQRAVVEETRTAYLAQQIDITEDTMPGELSNVIAGRIANLFNLRGPNFTTDAACASGLAALSASVHGLVEHDYDAVVTGGIDRNMGVEAFVKFCKIGALSATGTRPFDAGADGFVMGEGAALFVLKRLEDAEAAGDRIHAVILGIGGSSDGKGKGITAPNPVGQQLAVERAWESAGEDPTTASAVEAHGTSTRVGDAAELNSLSAVFGGAGAAPGSIALGSVKSNIGHLKAAAGTAGLFKMVYSLRERQLAPSLNFRDPNPNVDWDTVPFAVNTELRAWPEPPGGVRRGGVSAFGFGGTNFHVVVEEHVPGRHRPVPRSFASAQLPSGTVTAAVPTAGSAVPPGAQARPPLRGALVLGARDEAELLAKVRAAATQAAAGQAPAPAAPAPDALAAPLRAAVDFVDAAELAGKLDKLDKALASGNPAVFRMLRQQGVFVGRGPAPKVAFLYTGQGSQYVNMLQGLAGREPLVRATFDEADAVMTPLLGRSLTSYIFIEGSDADAVKAAKQQLLQTEITQPAVLATDLALTRLLAAYGVAPDMVMGHSLGEYGALVAAGSLTFRSALEAVSARGREMAHLSVEDQGAMAAVFGPLTEIERIVDEADGYVVIANINSTSQAVVGGATAAVERVVQTFTEAGLNAVRIPVSHAFHTSIVAPASEPLVAALRRLDVRGPQVPCVANVTGEFYPAQADTDTMLDYLGRQVASPVQFVRGLHTLYDAGARVFVEVGPKKALHGFVEDVLGSDHEDVVALYTNHPKVADEAAFNQALCGLYAAGLGAPAAPAPTIPSPATTPAALPVSSPDSAPVPSPVPSAGSAHPTDDTIRELGLLFAGVLEQGLRVFGGDRATTGSPAAVPQPAAAVPTPAPPALEPVVITGAGVGLPGRAQVFDDDNVAAILAGQQFIGQLPQDVRDRMVDMRITRVVKSESGAGSFATIDDPAEVIKLAGLHAPLDVVEQFGVDAARDEALDVATRLAIGAGLEAMRDAGIPLTLGYKTTTLGTQLPDR